MIQHWLRAVLLVAFLSASVGCALVQPPADKKETRQVRRPAQTGTYIPRDVPERSEQAKRQKKAKQPKPEPTPKRKRERAKPAGKVDEDFVTRGGFR
jgi:hypothetical protein